MPCVLKNSLMKQDGMRVHISWGEAASLCQSDYEKWVGTHANGGTAGTQLGDGP